MSWHLSENPIVKNSITVLFFSLFTVLCRAFGITCLFYKITSLPCPTCFMTRALFSLAKGDLKAYADYNIMALPVALVFLSELFIGLFGKYQKVINISSVIVLAVNLIYYAVRLLFT